MEKKPEIKAELPPISQIGILVNDAAKTAEYYSSVLGIGPFRTYEVDMPEGTTYRGKPDTGKLRIAVARMGPVDIEFIQVLEGAEFYTECLNRRGEGLHHLGIHFGDADAYDKFLMSQADQGVEPSFSVKAPGVSCAYIETVGGLLLEPIFMARR
jgi:catechol 2,3-dioxygenase-like lactoylglutathione lyase family enzyme